MAGSGPSHCCHCALGSTKISCKVFPAPIRIMALRLDIVFKFFIL